MSYISVEHLTKEIGNDTVLKDVTLSLEKRKIIGLEAKTALVKQCLCERSVASLSLPKDMFLLKTKNSG